MDNDKIELVKNVKLANKRLDSLFDEVLLEISTVIDGIKSTCNDAGSDSPLIKNFSIRDYDSFGRSMSLDKDSTSMVRIKLYLSSIDIFLEAAQGRKRVENRSADNEYKKWALKLHETGYKLNKKINSICNEKEEISKFVKKIDVVDNILKGKFIPSDK